MKYDYLNGQLRSVQDFSNSTLGTVYWQVDVAAPFGSTLDTLGNGVKVQNDFDGVTGTLSRVQAGVGGGAAIQNQSFLYDAVGNLSQRQNNNRGLTENLVNDAVDRISSSTVNGSANLAMSYAPSGNILSKTGTAGTWTYSASKPHQVTQAGSNAFSYDSNGNMISRNGYAIYWNSANYPTEIRGPAETFLFSYGPDRQRVRQVSANAQGSETTYYVGGALEKTILLDGSTDYRHTVYAGGQAVAIVSRSSSGTNTTRYLIEDHQGSSTTITNSNGSVAVEESFDAYGVPRDPTNWSGAQSAADQALIANITRHGYTGHTMLGNSGLIHMNGRVMDATIGRFISADPYVSEPGNTQNFNRYSYVYNNPLSFIDPSGFLTTLPPVSCPAGGCDRGIRPGIRLMPGDVRPAGGTHDSSKEPPSVDTLDEVVVAARQIIKRLKKWACNAGNSVATGSDMLGNVSGKLALTGLGVTAAGALAGQPEFGLGIMAVGGTGSVVAGVMQFGAGLLQGAGGGGFGNSGYAALSVGTGLILSRGIIGPASSGYRTVSQRAADSFSNGTATVAGGVNDFWSQFVDAAAPQQVNCPGGH